MTARLEQSVHSLHVEVALFHGDAIVQRGNIVLRAEEGCSCFGEHRHVIIKDRDVALFAGLIIEHRLEVPASPLTLRYFEVVTTDDPTEPLRQSLVFKSALRVGVHTSTDWENINFVKGYFLAFKCNEQI